MQDLRSSLYSLVREELWGINLPRKSIKRWKQQQSEMDQRHSLFQKTNLQKTKKGS